MYAVLDTSVLIAGLRSRRGASFQVLRARRHGGIRIAVGVALVLESEALVLRPRPLPAFYPEEIRRIPIGNCLVADHREVFLAGGRFGKTLTTLLS